MNFIKRDESNASPQSISHQGNVYSSLLTVSHLFIMLINLMVISNSDATGPATKEAFSAVSALMKTSSKAVLFVCLALVAKNLTFCSLTTSVSSI